MKNIFAGIVIAAALLTGSLLKTVSAEAALSGPVTSPASVILIGDSRTEGMINTVGDNGYTWVYQVGAGYDWMTSSAVPAIDELVGEGTKVLILMGVNDIGSLGNADRYATYINAKAEEWDGRGALVCYVSVTRCAGWYHSPYGADNAHILLWNEYMREALSDQVIYLDADSLLGIPETVDGLHYTAGSYRQLFAILQDVIGNDGEPAARRHLHLGDLDIEGLISGFIGDEDEEETEMLMWGLEELEESTEEITESCRF